MAQSYALEWDAKRQHFKKYNTQAYVPDTLATKGEYPILKPGEVAGPDGKPEPDPGVWFPENDLKVSVDHTKLLVLPQPWIFLQGYWHDDEHTVSLRLDVANQVSWWRIKDNKLGQRRKMRVRVPYALAETMIFHAPSVVYKYRFIKRDDTGRAWLVEYFPEFDHWQAETEIGEKVPYPDRFPVWAIEDVSSMSRYYTHSWVIVRSDEDIKRLLKEAADYGSHEPYAPGSGQPFNWLGK